MELVAPPWQRQLDAAHAAGEQPAALLVGYQNDQSFYQLNDVLVDLNNLMNDATWGLSADEVADFYPAFLENGSIDGQLWGVPFQRSTPVLYWNKEAFAAAGLDPEVPPATWEEQVELGKQLTLKDSAGNVTQYGVQIPTSGFPYWLFQGLTTQNDVILMNQAGNEVNFDDPRVVAALE